MRNPPTREQWGSLHIGAGRAHLYFKRVLARLEMRGFYSTDRIHQSVWRASEAAGSVAMHCHYFTIPGGVAGANELGPEADPVLWVGDGI